MKPHTGEILESILYRGELERSDVVKILGTTSRQARRITSALLNKGILVSKGIRAPFKLSFPATLATRWMPGLFPDK